MFSPTNCQPVLNLVANGTVVLDPAVTHVLWREDDFHPCVSDALLLDVIFEAGMQDRILTVAYGGGAYVTPVWLIPTFVSVLELCTVAIDECFDLFPTLRRLSPPLYTHYETVSMMGHAHACNLKCFVDCKDMGARGTAVVNIAGSCRFFFFFFFFLFLFLLCFFF